MAWICGISYILPQSKTTSDIPKKLIHRYRQHLQSGFIILCLGILCFLAIWSWMGEDRKLRKRPHHSILPQHHKGLNSYVNSTFQSTAFSTVPPAPDIGFSPDEWKTMLQTLYWPSPERPITNLLMSTSPTNTTFSILGLRESYQVGDELTVTVVAKDYQNNPKQYGGDYFQAKLFSSKLKASVFGKVLDHENGSYTLRFLLPWAGDAQVAVRMIYSSEAVQAVKHHRDSDFGRVYYHGYYEVPGPNGILREMAPCNIKWPGQDNLGTGDCCCEYPDPQTQEVWHCKRPRNLPCSALMYHSSGKYQNRLSNLENKVTAAPISKIEIKGDKRIITILPSNASVGVTEKCRPGMQTPVPAGFFLDWTWTSLVCATRRFTTPEAVQCLKGKHVYMMGDSTLRQWFDYLINFVPTLKRMNLHVEASTGPLIAVDVANNIDIHWRAHGLPIRCLKTAMADIHYISNELGYFAGGSHMVFIFNLGPHFTPHPLVFFARRVANIRKAVVALLRRRPTTTIIIKTVNTAYKEIYGNDWFSMQLDQVLREAFRGINVYILDVWQMTASFAWNKEDIHPVPIVIQNEIDILLSFVCPK